MATWDLIFGAVLLVSILWGTWRGVLLTLGGLVIGIVAGYLAMLVSGWFAGEVMATGELDNGTLAQVVFYLVWVLLFAIGNLLLQMVNFITNLPIVASVKRWLGALVGAIQGFFLIGLIVIVLRRYSADEALLTEIANSQLALWGVTITGWLFPILNQDWREAIDGWLEKYREQA